MLDEIAPLSFIERVARLEERMNSQLSLLDEIRSEQKALADTVARASGGLRVLMLVGGLTGAFGVIRHVFAWAGTLLPHLPGDGA